MKTVNDCKAAISRIEELEQHLKEHEEQIHSKLASLKEESEALIKRKEDILGRQKALMESNGGANVAGNDMIALNISGTEMFVQRDTITAVKGSMLAALFSGRWENQLERDSRGRVFIEADPAAFRKILEYLYIFKMPSRRHGEELTTILPHIESDVVQKNFDVYFNFFRLQFPMSAGNEDARASNPTPLLKELLENERTLQANIKKQLDEVEAQLESEESFVKSFLNPEHVRDICSRSQNSLTMSDIECEEFSISNSKCQETQHSNIFDEDLGILNLLVGGEHLVTKRSTLCLDPASMLAECFSSDKWLKEHLVLTEDGKRCFLVEQPLNCFKALLQQLHLKSINHDNMPLPPVKFNHKTENRIYERIVDYYFPQSSKVIKLQHFRMDSAIIDTLDHEDKIEEFLQSVNRAFNLKLLYRATRGDFRADHFHQTCDGRGATITLVKSTDGFIIGGFADKSWSSFTMHAKSKQAFLFYLRCQAGLPAAKFPLNYTSSSFNTLASNPTYGPTFGASNNYGKYKYDLCISSSSSGANCFVNIGNYYAFPCGYGRDFLTGSDNFELDLIEVFKVYS